MFRRGAKIIEAEDLSLELCGNTILSEINATYRAVDDPECPKGQVLGLLGPSGIGKTQLLKLLAKQRNPSSGRLTLRERTGQVMGPEAVRYVEQQCTISGDDTPYQLARKSALISNPTQSAKDRNEGMDILLERFHLKQCGSTPFRLLSGGEKQRAYLLAQWTKAPMVLLDEPFTGLDPLLTDQLRNLIRESVCKDPDLTIVVSSHDLAAVSTIADSLWLLGKHLEIGERQSKDGAGIRYSYDLGELGLAWRSEQFPEYLPEFVEFLREIRSRFSELI